MPTACVILTGASASGKTPSRRLSKIRIRKLLFTKGTESAFLPKKSSRAMVQWTSLAGPCKEALRSIGLA
jgi:hypothetical protein